MDKETAINTETKVPEAKTRVLVLTGHYRVTGVIDLLPGARVTDFLAESREFIAMTDAEVWDLNGRRLLSSSFLNINRDRIELIVSEQAATDGTGRLLGGSGTARQMELGGLF